MKQLFTIVRVFVLFFLTIWAIVYFLFLPKISNDLEKRYLSLNSPIIKDNKDNIIAIMPNSRGYYNIFLENVPDELANVLIQKEDKYFYLHPGFNPFSILRSLGGFIGIYGSKASSTISQQLAKILLQNEQNRSLKNKVIEFFYTLIIEIRYTKKEILKMYANSIYLGNSIQGINLASSYYFGINIDTLAKPQLIQLVASIQSPTNDNPLKETNIERAIDTANRLNLNYHRSDFFDTKKVLNFSRQFTFRLKTHFEISSFLSEQPQSCTLTIDSNLTEQLRKIVYKNIMELSGNDAFNAAAIVIKIPENEIIAAIGSPDPDFDFFSYQINMLVQPRQVGSTFKPFIYLKGFEKGLRPYTLVDDREYKYLTAIGFPLYPRNFDYKYNGEVTLHYALANSLNVPTLKVLEYVGLNEFYQFISQKLNFQPPQNLQSYQMGIALGTLEMSLFDLAKYFTIFPNKGHLKDIIVEKSGKCAKNNFHYVKKIADEKYIQLINKILADRKTSSDQFGYKSNLNLPYNNYALKTGTSRNFKDSWVIGYNPDFLVGVWVGNADVSSMNQLSGQKGAGIIWSEIMQLLFNSEYNKQNHFDFNLIKKYDLNGNDIYGLNDDDFQYKLNILNERNNQLIIFPHDQDVFVFEQGMKISLKSKEKVLWYINEKFMLKEKEFVFTPFEPGVYKIKAQINQKNEEITIYIN